MIMASQNEATEKTRILQEKNNQVNNIYSFIHSKISNQAYKVNPNVGPLFSSILKIMQFCRRDEPS